MGKGLDAIRDIAIEHGIDPGVLRSKRFPRKLFPVRRLVYIRLRELKMTWHQIASLMGGRDHSTIIHGVNTHRRDRDLKKIRAYQHGNKTESAQLAGKSSEEFDPEEDSQGT